MKLKSIVFKPNINIMSIEAKLFAIRCGINQTTNSSGISKIIIITNSIHAAKKFLTHLPILTRVIQLLSLRNFEFFLLPSGELNQILGMSQSLQLVSP